MITNYNDGDWHPWTGGNCPVHQDSIVDVIFNNIDNRDNRPAGKWHWNGGLYHKIVAFRVTKEYKPEPREFWITAMGPMMQHDIQFKKPDNLFGYIHVKEVL